MSLGCFLWKYIEIQDFWYNSIVNFFFPRYNRILTVGSVFGHSLLLSELAQTQRAQYNKFGRENGLKNWALVRVATTRHDHTEME